MKSSDYWYLATLIITAPYLPLRVVAILGLLTLILALFCTWLEKNSSN